ncbi:hypothetical protein DFH06DRAFT_1307255 [Mycena polygramma]|nr:hypothetical protein DFH06DRAFT_1307255 [Mycena polygramma]
MCFGYLWFIATDAKFIRVLDHTNYVPTDTEIERIRSYLEPHEAESARLDSLVRELTVQRERVKDHIQSHRALISLPRRLPQDLLEQIFLACLPTRYNAVMSAMEPPLLLGRICSAWRSIAFSMPRLWASLHVTELFISANEQRKAAMADWLGIGPVPAHNIADFSSQLANTTAPWLSEINIEFRGNMVSDSFTSVLSSLLIRDNPSERVTIVIPWLDVLIPISAPFSWDHLTDLSLLGSDDNAYGLTVSAVHQLLKGCTRLVSLWFRLHYGDGTGDLSTEVLLHASLESFSIAGIGRSFSAVALRHLIDHLELPHLLDTELLLDLLQKQSDYAPNLRRLDLLLWGRPPDIPDVTLFIERGFEVLLRLPPTVEPPQRSAWGGYRLTNRSDSDVCLYFAQKGKNLFPAAPPLFQSHITRAYTACAGQLEIRPDQIEITPNLSSLYVRAV